MSFDEEQGVLFAAETIEETHNWENAENEWLSCPQLKEVHIQDSCTAKSQEIRKEGAETF